MSAESIVTQADREHARRIVAEHYGYDVVENVSDHCAEVEFVLMGIKAHRVRTAAQPQEREAVVWRDYTSAPLSFDGGLISVNRDGSGYFTVNENEANWETDDEDGTTYIVAKFSAGEAHEIRDHLNKYFPTALTAPIASAVSTDEIVAVLEPLVRFHETGGHEGDGSDAALERTRAILSRLRGEGE